MKSEHVFTIKVKQWSGKKMSRCEATLMLLEALAKRKPDSLIIKLNKTK